MEELNKTENSQKFLLKTFCYNNKDTGNGKDLQKLCNKEILINTTHL